MRSLALSILVLLCLVTPALGQEKPKGFAEFNAFLDKPREGWEWDEDERLDDLLMQLQEKELALQAVDLRTARLQGKKGSAKMDERMAWRAVDRMDLNAGGPVRWDAFYGRNAENFFYHPVDRNTTYHTTTVLQQVQPTSAGGVPGNQGVPAHQRPPQFDYIYRGYERRQAKAKEEASEITNKLEILQDRRRQLEEEVILLWTKIAFRVLDRDKVAEKPVLRWASLPVNGDNKEDSERAVAFNEATHLLAVGLLFNEQRVESEAEKVFSTVGTAIQTNRRNFEDSLLRAGVLLDDSEDKTKPIGQYKFLSRKLEDVSKSLSEGYRGWRDGDENDDEPTKFVGLRRVQDSVVTYAKILLALNELVDVMKKDWELRVNPESTEFVPKWDVAYTTRATPKPAPASVPKAKNGRINMFASDSLEGWKTEPPIGRPNWSIQDGILTCTAEGSHLVSDEVFEDFEFSLEFLLPPRCNSGLYLRNQYEIQFLDPLARNHKGEVAKPGQMSGAVWGYAPPQVLSYLGPNRWNRLEGTIKGDTLTVKINGKLVQNNLRLNRKMGSNQDEPVTTVGPFLIQYHTDTVGMKIRNFVVTRL